MTYYLPDLVRRARIAILVAGLAWLFGLAPPPGIRIAVVALVAAAILLDAWLDQQQPRPSRLTVQTDHQTAA
ncbi:hypothetical protein [Streptomyces sp. NRRL F-5135]|uniref:hypothetical protein n=1 Tax=Streptomyces sp. NRRL F-5135 TaxID=1463858 RepID=UPI0004C7E846|nr:hypothetical protein [Streptomyces sp. NRRL F-5135]